MVHHSLPGTMLLPVLSLQIFPTGLSDFQHSSVDPRKGFV
jgi:hypothetical protein